MPATNMSPSLWISQRRFPATAPTPAPVFQFLDVSRFFPDRHCSSSASESSCPDFSSIFLTWFLHHKTVPSYMQVTGFRLFNCVQNSFKFELYNVYDWWYFLTKAGHLYRLKRETLLNTCIGTFKDASHNPRFAICCSFKSAPEQISCPAPEEICSWF